MSIKNDAMIVAGGVALVVLAAWYIKTKGAEVIAEAAPYVNPADSRNVVNQGVEAIGSSITGVKDWSLGTQIYDWTH